MHPNNTLQQARYNQQAEALVLEQRKIQDAEIWRADLEADRRSKQAAREQRLQIAQANARAKAIVDYLEGQRQQKQAAQVEGAASLLTRVNVNSLNFPKVISMIKGTYPLAFETSKDKQDTNLLNHVKSLEDEHRQIMGFQIEQAKELGLTLDASNPGWDEKTHTIDWDKARKAREGWNAANAQKAGATGDYKGTKLTAQSIDEKGAVKYGNQQTMLEQKESDNSSQRTAGVVKFLEGKRADYDKLRIASQGNFEAAQAAAKAAGKTDWMENPDVKGYKTKMVEYTKQVKEYDSQIAALKQPAQPATDTGTGGGIKPQDVAATGTPSTTTPPDAFVVGKTYKNAKGQTATYKGNGSWE